MDRASVEAWLRSYVEAWKSYDRFEGRASLRASIDAGGYGND